MALASFGVLAATATSPIIVTTTTDGTHPAAHGMSTPVGGAPVVQIANVQGLAGCNGTFQCTVPSATTLALIGTSGLGVFAFNAAAFLLGPLDPLTALVGLLSTELNARLAAAGLGPLANGGIMLGAEHVGFENYAPPSVVFVPVGDEFEFGGPPQLGGVANAATIKSATERKAQLSQKPILTDVEEFEVHVWGQAPQGVYANVDSYTQRALDFGVTKTLVDHVLRTIQKTTIGTFTLSKGKWPKKNSDQNAIAGREFVFNCKWRRPVLDDPYTFVAPNPGFTKPNQTVKMVVPENTNPPEPP